MTMLILAATAVFSFGEVKVECKNPADGWRVSLVREIAPDGAEIAKFSLDSDVAKVPPKTWLSLDVPQVGMHNAWSVNGLECGVRANWEAGTTTEVSRGLPVFVYFDGNDTSHFAVAAEECVRHLRHEYYGVRPHGNTVATPSIPANTASRLSAASCWATS